MGQEVVSSYLRSKLSSILEEAEGDSGSPSHIISRFRSIQSQIESTGANSLIPVDLLYDLIDALSECRVFAYQRHAPQVSKKGFNLNKLYRPLSEFMFRRRIRKRLDTIDDNLRAPSPRDSQPPAKLHIPLTHPIPDTSLIIGLDVKAETIEAWLMATASSEEEEGDALRAVGIVGRCGCGKTALAQKVFASPKVVEKFSPRIWVCLSNMLFDNDPRVGIVNYILGEIVNEDEIDLELELGLEELVGMLEQRLMGKRYMIVLDDAWRLPGDPHFLSQGLPKGSGGAVIVTSRRKDVISQMVGDEHVIRLEPDLSGEICWQILSTDIQQQRKMKGIHPKLSRIEDDVKRNFDGLPLVAKSFASMLPDLLIEGLVAVPFPSAIFQVLFQQLTSAAIKGLARREKVESHFEKLRHNLATIQAVLEDAEEKQLTQKSVKLWLESLRDLAYDLEDILDEITTQALVQHSKRIQQSRASTVWKLIPTCGSFSPSAIVSNHKMMSKIKEFTNRLQFIVKQRTYLGLVENAGGPSNRSSVMRTPNTSLVNESQVYGRDEDKEAITKMLLMGEELNDGVSVIPIVGMGGIGKTTLAQLVYNDRNVKQNFHKRAWVCVSEEFDVISITRTLYESITGESAEFKGLDMLQVRLKEELGKSKFLIVLDDVWNDNYEKWDDLRRPFQFGTPGSRIIVTTRNESVASVVGSPRTAYHMKLLNDEDCLSLLAVHASRSLHGNSELKEVGLGLVKKCKGLPLAAKTLGGLLRSKETKEEWCAVLNSEGLVGELFLSTIVQVLFQQLTSAAIKGLASREKVESHFEKLRHNLATIQAVLEDAEEKQLTQKSVKLWLESLRDLAYDLEDILDQITTQALVQQSKRIQQSRAASMVQNLFPACCSFSPGAIVSNHKLMSKIKVVTKRLQLIVKERTELGLVENPGGPSNRSSLIRTPTTSLVNESQVYGRDEDKEAITKMLLMGEECHDGVSVIPIVGMGGIGKTTLAQLVYNDRNVKQNFHKRAWVCVSEEFDVISITRTIYESITGESAESKGLDMLQVRLKEELGKSKFLIVLDDVWNDNYVKWDDLRRPFQFGAPGSRIIVTTRNESVASVVGSPRTAYHMKLLNDEDCLSLLAVHASRSLHGNSELKEVGLGLVKKCKGLPLAAKTLGGLLRFKTTKEEWCAVLNSEVRYLQEANILPVLGLSYHHLPSHLKHLFAYCSIFPRHYDFKKNELVYLWMAEGFLEKPNESESKEVLGHAYFNELLSRSFFQRSSESDEFFVMHDLINDLAQVVAEGACFRLDEKMDTNQEYKIPEKARHGSFLRHEYEVFGKFKAFNQVKGLRTFLPMPVENSLVWPPFYLSNKILAELVPELHSLRVLSLSGYSITELPSSICNLLHLRYLNLSGTSIITLPDTLGDIYNLQTLSLHKCRSICKLPSTLGKLSNLRHLDNSDTDQLKDMPIEIGQLRNLQTLPKIVLSKAGGLGLRELRGLKHLRGSLSILELQNVTNIEDVKDARLFTHELDELQLTWGSDMDQTLDRSAAEEEVLDLLRPCENLRSLKIVSYGGFSFPSWIGLPSFDKLSSISILNCLGCKSLPSLGQLPELKHLLIGNMPNIKCISTEFYGSGVMVPFPKLETLRFDHMPEWEEWAAFADGEDIKFPHLHQLTMSKCSKLTRVSPLNFPALRELDLEKCNKVLLESFSDLDSLNSLKVEAITGLSYLPRELTLSLSALEVLECCSCSELISLWPNETPLEHLTHLKRLVIADCKQLVSLGQGEQQFPSKLEVLEVFRCANLITLPNDLSDLSSLRELIIKNCLKFISFPESGLPPMLKRLEILSCNALESLPSNMSDLERLEIKDCSSLKTFARDGFPVSLKKLAIKNCTQLEPISEMMFPQNSSMMQEDLSLCTWPNFSNLLQRLHGFSHLAELYLSSCYGLRRFPEQGLPPSLRALSIEDCANLKSLPAMIRSMTSLELRSCPRLDNFPKYDLPPNLSSLRIWDSKKFKPLANWGLHRLTSLREFSICGGFEELEVLGHGNDLFPPSLIRFSIARFPKLTSLFEVLERLTSLRHLSIMNCAHLNDLPSEGLLEKLWHLEISDCPLLKPKCMRYKGEYWPKISGIPCVEIDGTYIYKQSSV